MPSTRDWSYSRTVAVFPRDGCAVSGCTFNAQHHPDWNFCALNVSDALLRVGYTLPAAAQVNYCEPAHAKPRVRNADGLARICRAQNNGEIDASTWAARPSWKGIVFFEGNLGPVTGHIDLWNGTDAVHTSYPHAATVWFWKLGT